MRSPTASRVLSAAQADIDHLDPLRREWAGFMLAHNPTRTRVLPSEEFMTYSDIHANDTARRRDIYAARDEVYDPQPAVPDDAAYEAMIRSAWRVPGSVAADGQATFLPEDRIDTEPADLDDAKRSTEAGGLIAVALMAAVIFGVPFAVWLWRGVVQ